MQESILNLLLDEVKRIVNRNYTENFKQGKNFNIFYIQGTVDDEVRVCRLIRELLDPKGRHGQDAFFLRNFMRKVLKTNEFTDDEYRNAVVIQEAVIDYARRIDLVIRIKGRLFPIEVKIYAEDQVNQCQDYYDYAVRSDPEAKLYYLTLDGHDPSDTSKGNLQPGQYEKISFSNEILEWLDECIEANELENIYSVKEILIQFRDVLRNLTGKLEDNKMMEIEKEIGSTPERIKAAIHISNALPYVMTEKMKEVFGAIKCHMESLGFFDIFEEYQKKSEEYYSSERPTWPSINCVIQDREKLVDGEIAFRIEIGERLYCGIVPWSGINNWAGEKDNQIAGYVRENLTPANILGHKEEKYWYWWDYIDESCPANYKQVNDEYYQLYDEKGFNDYMKKICSSLNLVLKSIGMITD